MFDMNSAAVCCAKPEVKGSMTVISIPSLAMSSSFFRRVTRRGGHRSGAMTDGGPPHLFGAGGDDAEDLLVPDVDAVEVADGDNGRREIRL
jgi:hypothetical protein